MMRKIKNTFEALNKSRGTNIPHQMFKRVFIGELKSYDAKKQKAYMDKMLSFLCQVPLNCNLSEKDKQFYSFDAMLYEKEYGGLYTHPEVILIDTFRHAMESFLSSFALAYTEPSIVYNKDFPYRFLSWGASDTEDYLELYFLHPERTPVYSLLELPIYTKEKCLYEPQDFILGDLKKNKNDEKFILFGKYFDPKKDDFIEVLESNILSYFKIWRRLEEKRHAFNGKTKG